MPLSKAALSRLRSLNEKKQREDLGLFVVEGEKVVKELLAAAYPLLEIYATPEAGLGPNHARVEPVTVEEMARISHFPNPSSLLAVGRLVRPTLDPAELQSGFTLVLDGIQDPGNVGTLLRIADWFGIDRVVLSPDCADLFSQKVINASMGSFSRVRAFSASLPELLSAVGKTVPVYGCELVGEPVASLPRLGSGAIVAMGSEGRGLSPAVAACVGRRVTIPRFGQAESLNVAVAAGIVCAHLRGLA